MMEGSFVKLVLCYFTFSEIYSTVFCSMENKRFGREHVFDDKTCPMEDIIFTETAPSKIVCASKCFERSDCRGVSYSTTDLLCTGCDKFSETPTNLVDKQGSVIFVSEIAECGEPLFSDTHVILGTFDGNSQHGAQVSYTCTPCTFFPQAEPAVITCQADATWSTPVCVYGPDVGRLSNGQEIPEEAIGCALTFGNTCSNDDVSGSALLMDGTTGRCYCDSACCSNGDCCFDSTCDDDEAYYR